MQFGAKAIVCVLKGKQSVISAGFQGYINTGYIRTHDTHTCVQKMDDTINSILHYSVKLGSIHFSLG